MRTNIARAAVVSAGAVALAAGASRAQTMPGDVRAPVDPGRAVDAALNGARPVQRTGASYDSRNPHNWITPLRTARGRCYELLGVAAGPSRVQAQVYLRRARVGEPLSLASSTGDVSRTRFCATLPGAMYSVVLHAEGPTRWALATHEVPPDEPAPDPNAAQRERLLNALANDAAGASTGSGSDAGSGQGAGGAGGGSDAGTATGTTAVTYPVGGEEPDYPGNQLRSLASSLPGSLPFNAAVRAQLGTNQSREVRLSLGGGQCVVLAAAGVPSVADVDIEISDPAGHRVAQDAQHRGVESVRYCAPYTGTYRATVRVFAGGGLVGIQAFEVQ